MQNIIFTIFFTSLLFNGMGLSLGKSAIASTFSSERINKEDVVRKRSRTIRPGYGLSLIHNRKGINQKVRHNTQHEQQFISQSLQNSTKQSRRLPRKIARRVLRDASKRSSLPSRRLKFENTTRRTFGNPCIFKFGEVCTREFDPIEGWEVTVRVREKLVTYHTDETGTQIVLDPNASFTAPTKLPENFAYSALQDASRRSGVAVKDLEIKKATFKTFSNSCTFNFGEVCTREFNPIEGWEVLVSLPATYRVNRTNSRTTEPCEFDSDKVCDREVEIKSKNKSVIYHINESTSQIVIDPNAKLSLYGK